MSNTETKFKTVLNKEFSQVEITKPEAGLPANRPAKKSCKGPRIMFESSIQIPSIIKLNRIPTVPTIGNS